MLKYAIIVLGISIIGALSMIAIGSVCAQIAQPIAQVGGGVSIAQPVAQGGFAGQSVVSAPFVSSGFAPGYRCYQPYPGGPFTCYPASGRVYASGGTYFTSGGVYQPVQQVGTGTQIAAPVAVI
jgi:hypothetical protein